MDISDGLSSELMHICEQSQVGCQIFEEKIPVDYQTYKMAEELNLSATVCALNGGEDYELLFTVPLEKYDLIKEEKDIKVIGHITPANTGKYMITRDNTEIELKAQGWNPLEREDN